jgi:cytochrome c553
MRYGRKGQTEKGRVGGLRGSFPCKAVLLGGVVLAILALVVAPSRAHAQAGDRDRPASQDAGRGGRLEFPVPPKPLPRTITPCSACHGKDEDFPVNPRRREDLRVHTQVQLNHGGVRVWCLDCHHPGDRDFLLPLSDGEPIPFERSYLLCGKCHGTKYRDWRNGIHGRRTGSWSGEKSYLLCVHCHEAHSPRFKPMRPMPPPDKPWIPTETRAAR